MSIKSDPKTWSDARHRRGVEGEEIARAFLERRGWTVLQHRYRLGRLEIDLIARRGRVVAFIEVKTRRSRAFGTPVEAVTWTKRREIVRVALAWIDRFGERGQTYRLDVIGVCLARGRPPHIEHIEDAFRANWR